MATVFISRYSLFTVYSVSDSAHFKSRAFYKYNISGLDIDLIAGFRIFDNGTIYEYPLESWQITDSISIHGAIVPLMSLDVWINYYERMHRTTKADMIRKFLLKIKEEQ